MNNEVLYVRLARETAFAVLDNRWELTTKHKWVRRLFYWAVKRGWFRQSQIRTETYTEHRFDPSSVLDSIRLQQIDMMRLWSQEATTICMGRDAYMDLMRNPDTQRYASFNVLGLELVAHGERRVFGLTLKVVPWMRGVVVLP